MSIPKGHEDIIEALIQCQFRLTQLPTKEALADVILLLGIASIRVTKLRGFEEAVELAEAELLRHKGKNNEPKKP